LHKNGRDGFSSSIGVVIVFPLICLALGPVLADSFAFAGRHVPGRNESIVFAPGTCFHLATILAVGGVVVSGVDMSVNCATLIGTL
jgi:hypothetical protein